ncbi:MAG: hypothetical protein QOF70_1615 [Acetobacteraceae bacterium]|nr:hypothetical protein [Acetobacteraceae bacterium]
MNNQDRTGDRQADSLADGRWMTFAELSQSRGISKTSAMKLVSQHGLRRQKNNKGQVRALVPVAWVRAEDTKEPNSAADMSRAIRAFDSAIATLREQLVRETGRTEAAERARTALTVRLAQAEAGQAAERSRAAAEGGPDTGRGGGRGATGAARSGPGRGAASHTGCGGGGSTASAGDGVGRPRGQGAVGGRSSPRQQGGSESAGRGFEN